MSLREWLEKGWLREHKTTRTEIAAILAVADRDLADSRAVGLSADGRFQIAYSAALEAATAALAAAGYRPGRVESQHYRVLQSLALTVGATPQQVSTLESFRKKRNIASYERAGLVSQEETREMMELAEALRKKVEEWLRSEHPELL